MFAPYRRSTILSFENCGNRSALISPPTEDEMRGLVQDFVIKLRHAGFDVTRTDGAFDTMHHRFFEAGEEYGYTMGAVLSASDASVHTYPETAFNATFELDLNLCYLWPEVEEQHAFAIAEAELIFKDWLRSDEPIVEVSNPRLFGVRARKVA